MTMQGLMITACILCVFLCTTISCAASSSVRGVLVSCMIAYEEGGARAVLSSPECSQWVKSVESSFRNLTRNCQFATLQGHRDYQEDRVACNLDFKIPFPGNGGYEEVSIGIAAVFDGHGGAEASEMASRKLYDYLFVNVVFTANKLVLARNNAVDSSLGTLQMNEPRSVRQVLEEALVKTLQDIDSEFSKEALEKGIVGGSTGTVVLLFDGQYLVANIGDSKAVLGSQKKDSHPSEGVSSDIYAEELTRDHHPDREDEKARIEAAGGFVRVWGVPRVNGILAVSRAIGDVPLKRYGVIAEPEITGWRAFVPGDKFLVIASDGIFETLTPQEVCDLIHSKASESLVESTMSSSSALAELIVGRAFEKGSTDNLSAIVISDLYLQRNITE